MDSYKYVSPEQQGYKRVKVNKRKWNKVFPYKREHFSWKQTIHVFYEKDNGFLIERHSTLLAKTIVIIAYPILLLMAGLGNIKHLNKECKSVIFQKKYGGFLRDEIGKNSKYYSKASECIID